MIRNEYLAFIVKNPRFVFDLFAYHKPRIILDLLGTLIGSIGTVSRLLAGISLVLVIALFVSPRGSSASRVELATSLGFVWLCSFLPVFWAYPAPHVFADQLWSTLFGLLAVAAFSGAALARNVLWRRQSAIQRGHQPLPSEVESMEVPVPETVLERPSQGQAAEIKMFCLKAVIVAVVAFIFMAGVFVVAQLFVDRQLAKIGHELAIQKAELRDLFLKGGSGVVVAAERRLYALADQEDFPPERKAKIIAAIKKVSARYRLYLEAAEPPARD